MLFSFCLINDLIALNLGYTVQYRKPRKMNKLSTAEHSMSLEDQATLMKGVVSNEAAAFAELSQRFRPFVFSIVYGVLNDLEDAEDVTQDVFMSIWRKASAWSPSRGSLTAWVASIARNRAIDIIRSKNRRSSGNKRYQEECKVDVGAFADSAADSVSKSEEHEIARLAVGELCTGQREAIELTYFHGLSQSEVSERMGLSLGTTKSRIRRGVSKLREKVPFRLSA